jgi:hypothetical protein
MRPYTHEIIEQSVSATSYSEVVDVQHLTFVSYQLVVNDGNLVGSTNLQVSNDGVNFVDIAATSVNYNGVGTTLTQVVDVCAKYVRVKVTVASGSSNITIIMVNKGNS